MSAGLTRMFLVVWLILSWSGLSPSNAQPPPSPAATSPHLKIDAPTQVKPLEAFVVKITSADRTLNGSVISLILLDSGSPARLRGTLETHLVDGLAVFPAVILSAEGGAELAVRLGAITSSGGQNLLFVCDSIHLTAPPQPSFGSARFDEIPTIATDTPYPLLVTVTDATGAPLPGAKVSVRLDPEHSRANFLFFHSNIQLKDESGQVQTVMEAVSNANGKALFILQVCNDMAPFAARLLCSVQWQQKTLSGTPSNVFRVTDRTRHSSPTDWKPGIPFSLQNALRFSCVGSLPVAQNSFSRPWMRYWLSRLLPLPRATPKVFSHLRLAPPPAVALQLLVMS